MLELEVEIDEDNDCDIDDIDMKIMEKIDNEDYELEFLGYFEEGKVKAHLNFNMEAIEKNVIFSNHSELY
jgi:hypothetical protein